MKAKHALSAAAVVAALTIVPHASALRVKGIENNPNTYTRFAVAAAGNLVDNLNPLFLAEGCEISGIGWHGDYRTNIAAVDKAVTLITPRHFVFAAHYNVGVGTNVQFRCSDGVVHTRRVTATYKYNNAFNLPADLAVGEFADPLPPSVHPFRIAPNEGLSLSGERIMAYGKRGRFGTNQIPTWFTPGRDYLPWQITGFVNQPDGTALGESGDSGSPTFVRIGDELVLVGVRFFATGDSWAPFFIRQIDQSIAHTGYRVTQYDPNAGCPADLDSSGQVDVFDLFMALEYVDAGDPELDLTPARGAPDIFDLLTYLDYMEQGCD